MMSEDSITIDGYEFDISIYVRASVLVGDDAPLDDKGYIKALRKVQKLLPYFQSRHWFNTMGEQAGMDSVMAVIEAYEKRLISVHPDTYRRAISIRNGIPAPRNHPAPKAKPLVAGYVYLIESSSGHFKIGRSVEPDGRLRTFGVQLPFEITPIALIKTHDCKGLEKSLHLKYVDKRVNGEWFNLAPDDVEYIKSLAVEA